MQCLSFVYWLTLFHIRSSRVIHAVAYNRVSSSSFSSFLFYYHYVLLILVLDN